MFDIKSVNVKFSEKALTLAEPRRRAVQIDTSINNLQKPRNSFHMNHTTHENERGKDK